MDLKEIGICIVTLESRDEALACLDSVFTSLAGANFDVVVVDNNSQDGTPEAIAERYPPVRLIRNAENVGFGRAVNQGLRTLQARYLILLNPDSIVTGDAFRQLARFMDEHPESGICTPRVLNRDGSLQFQCRRGEARPWDVFAYFSGLARLFSRDPRFTGYLLTYLDNDQVNEVKAVSGSCMMIRGEVIEQIGLLDERYFAYQEDADYCFQARKAGWKIYYVPAATVIHAGGRGGSRVRPYRAVYEWHRSYYMYYNKNLSKDYPFWFHPIYYTAMLFKFVLNVIQVFFSTEKIVGTKKP